MNNVTVCKTKRLANPGPWLNQDWDDSTRCKAKRELLANPGPGLNQDRNESQKGTFGEPGPGPKPGPGC
eukprot:1754086-Rhodomonas_salina.1